MVRYLVATAVTAAALFAPAAHAASSTAGTLELSQGGATLSYDWTGAPLLPGPEAAERVGLDPSAIRASDSRYVPATLRAFSLWPGPISVPDCRGFETIPGAQSVAIGDARALIAVDSIRLDVLRGRGEAYVSLANTGADELAFGEYPAPGKITVTTRSCTDAETGAPVPADGSFSAVDEFRAVAMSGPGLFRRYAPEALEDRPLALRHAGGVWRGELAIAEPASGSYPAAGARLALTLSGTPAEMNARCTLPSAMKFPGTSVRSRHSATALLRRAGSRARGMRACGAASTGACAATTS